MLRTISNDIIQIKVIKNQMNLIYRLLVMNNKLKNSAKNKDEVDSSLEYNEPVLFSYHKRHKDEDDKSF
jgi:hypothetical protein